MSSQCFTFMKVTIGNPFTLSVQLNLMPTKQSNEHDDRTVSLIKRISVTVPREVN